MNSLPSKGRLERARPVSGRKIIHLPPTQENLATIYLLQALHQEKVLFWFSLSAASAATLLQLCVIVCAVAHSHTEIQMASRLLISLSFNTVAVVAYRQAREVRRWASALLIETQKIHLTASNNKGREGDISTSVR
ncbi:MAG TPA: hypothetical protein VF538_00100 [Pyrinomonadaceae bacterium]|jgi:hypothetical protein